MNEIKKLDVADGDDAGCLTMAYTQGQEGQELIVAPNGENITALWEKQCEIIDAVNELAGVLGVRQP